MRGWFLLYGRQARIEHFLLLVVLVWRDLCVPAAAAATTALHTARHRRISCLHAAPPDDDLEAGRYEILVQKAPSHIFTLL